MHKVRCKRFTRASSASRKIRLESTAPNYSVHRLQRNFNILNVEKRMFVKVVALFVLLHCCACLKIKTNRRKVPFEFKASAPIENDIDDLFQLHQLKYAITGGMLDRTFYFKIL